ncbi:GntR family transcriptional regulator [Micromonospora sp. NPDC005194]|uniref:GntR family transcriptional regulator n=1 Tax=Micromonospora sp. NPDC005194 TaxID=3156870 RepID=UPI0033B6B6AC
MPTPHYGLPRYRVIAEELRGRIRSRAIDQLMPTETVLMQEFSASRGTVRQALAVLREEGLIATAPGRGSYVREAHNESHVRKREDEVFAPSDLAELFGLPQGARLRVNETIVLRAGAAHTVTRVYRRLSDQGPC